MTCRNVTREEFTHFIRANPDLVDQPVIGHFIAAMQYFDPGNLHHAIASAVYTRGAAGEVVQTTYSIMENV